MGRGADTLDTINYKTTYYNSVNVAFSESYEKLYLLLQKIGNFLGLNYIQFRLLLVVISWILIRSFLKKYTNNIFYILFFYLLFGIIIDTVQIRNFFALSLVIFGLKYLFTDEKKSRLKYFVCVLIAMNIHLSSIVYFVFLLVRVKNPKAIVKPIIFFTVLFCLIILLLGNNVPFLNDLMLSLESDKLTYYTQGKTSLGFLFPMVFHLGILGLVYLGTKLLKDSLDFKNNNELSLRNGKIIEIIFWINIITIIFFPFYIYNVQFIRLTRNLILINLLGFSILQVPLIRSNIKLFFMNFGVLLSMGFIYYFTFILQDHIEDVIIPFFDSQTLEP